MKETQSEVFKCPSYDFNDFEKDRKPESFSPGQIWAIYGDNEAVPRSYAYILKVISPAASGLNFNLDITWLKPVPVDENEMKWVDEGLPVSCGNFSLGKVDTTKDVPMLSHLLSSEIQNGLFVILPRKGETWAIFRDWSITWSHDSKRRYEYDYVEILSDYSGGMGVWVSHLEKVNGFRSLYSREKEVGTTGSTEIIPASDKYRFSHMVLSFRMTGEEWNGVPIPKGCYELDPSALLVPAFEKDTELDIIQPLPQFACFNQDLKQNSFTPGQIWAAYDNRDGMPRSYAYIVKVTSPGFNLVVVTWLQPVPETDHEKNWVRDNLPVSCGSFRLGDLDTSADHETFSHLVNSFEVEKEFFYNVPRKGEVWALFQDWSINWSAEDGDGGFEYEFVEVLSEYDENVGFKVLFLEKVAGFRCLFSRKEALDTIIIPAGDKYRFSHMVPSCKMTGQEMEGVSEGCYELDPWGLPVATSNQMGRRAEFNDFLVKEEHFTSGQIWAMYANEDYQPRTYAYIRKVISPQFKLLITWLNPVPGTDDEMNWVDKGLSVSCGNFRHAQLDMVKSNLKFSHLVSSCEVQKGIFHIIPRKGETWALFLNWSIKWSDQKYAAFKFVEITSDYDEDVGFQVSCINNVNGFGYLFCPEEDGEVMVIPASDKYRFSHMIPSCRMRGDEREGVPKGSYELDPAGLSPWDYQQRHVVREFNNFEIEEKSFIAGQIWATFVNDDGKPRLYAYINKVISPGFNLQVTLLKPVPENDDETNWVNRDFPVSCGKFTWGEVDNFENIGIFSHSVIYKKIKKGVFHIIPRKGETWALFRNWSIKWSTRRYQYDFVEILSDYDKKVGFQVSYLEKVDGFLSLFSRKKDGELVIPPSDKYRFWHRVPSYWMKGNESEGVPKGCYELNPCSLPASTYDQAAL